MYQPRPEFAQFFLSTVCLKKKKKRWVLSGVSLPFCDIIGQKQERGNCFYIHVEFINIEVVSLLEYSHKVSLL